MSYQRQGQQDQKMEIRNTNMPTNMQEEVLEVARRAMDRSKEPREIASYIKKEFDQRHSPNWHCIVGNHFGRYAALLMIFLSPRNMKGYKTCKFRETKKFAIFQLQCK